ncbi:extracellular solute-binding protein [uncultured Desulfuromonas sp.]|uniref:ABC transporter substrate-binding protein n=1 Tax=uncultured Desulfuromonas sp. TaxID=181013 RepID=UPI00263311A2|nr:extracellular solute-binding protein [uncultured Desulfuromonas sp.]
MKWKILLLFTVMAGFAFVGHVIKQRTFNAKSTIVVLGEDSSNLRAYGSLTEEFTSKTGIELKFEGATFEQSVQKADADFRNGKGNYDIVLQYNFSLAPYVRNNYVVDIENVFSHKVLEDLLVNEKMFQNALRETSYYYSNPQDTKSIPKQFGFPFAANTMLLVYNKDLFEDADIRRKYRDATGKTLAPPSEWSDYLTIAEFFANVQPGLKGVCMQGAADGWLYYELANYLFGMGTGTSTKRNGWEEEAPLTISTKKNEEVLRYVKRLRATSSGDFFTIGASQQQEIMLQGKTAMALMWSDYVQPLSGNSETSRFGFSPIPGRVSGLAGGAFYINRNSRHLDAASQFMLFVLAPENQKRLIEKGLCSAMKTAYTDEIIASVPYARALRDSLDRGVFMFEAGSDAEIINSALTTYVQKYIRGEISEAEALSQAEREVLAKRVQEY